MKQPVTHGQEVLARLPSGVAWWTAQLRVRSVIPMLVTAWHLPDELHGELVCEERCATWGSAQHRVSP